MADYLFDYLLLILTIIFGYLFGSIPWGYLISRIKGIDIRKVGSGNIGAVNVGRILGFKWGLFVFGLDFLKGLLPVKLTLSFLHPLCACEGDWLKASGADWFIALVALLPVLGHLFPIWLKFKGGKGVATTIGVIFPLLDGNILLIFLLIWLLILFISKIASFSNLLMASFLPLTLWLSSSSLAYFILGLGLFALIWWAHRENLKRIKENQEPKIKFKSAL